jgi:hypothetical protein
MRLDAGRGLGKKIFTAMLIAAAGREIERKRIVLHNV